MTMFGYLLGFDSLVVGIEDDPDEPDLTRIYIDARYLNRYVLVDADAADQVRRAWSQAHHVAITRPPDDRIYVDTPIAGVREPSVIDSTPDQGETHHDHL